MANRNFHSSIGNNVRDFHPSERFHGAYNQKTGMSQRHTGHIAQDGYPVSDYSSLRLKISYLSKINVEKLLRVRCALTHISLGILNAAHLNNKIPSVRLHNLKLFTDTELVSLLYRIHSL